MSIFWKDFWEKKKYQFYTIFLFTIFFIFYKFFYIFSYIYLFCQYFELILGRESL